MTSDFENYLFKRRARASGEHGLVSFISHVGVACLTAVLLWTMVPKAPLIIWLLGAMVLSAGNLYMMKSLTPDKRLYSKKRWSIAAISNSFSIAFFWSLAPSLLFVADNTLYIVIVVAIYVGYVSGALAVTSSYKYSFIGFTVGATAPLVARLLYEGGALHNTVAGLMIFYVTMLMVVCNNLHKLFTNTVQTQYTNEQLLEELAKEKEAVEKAVTAKDQFLAAASHDLRQPLNAISLFTEALKPLQTNAKASEILVKLRQSLNGLNGMLYGLLDISRLDAGAVDNDPKHVLLKPVADQLCEEYRHNTKNLKIASHVSGQMVAFVDPTILYRVLHNLLDNAVKYTNQGEVSVFTSNEADGYFHLTVKDSGIGIPEDRLADVFDEFQQLNNPERDRDKGLGLGLAIVKRLCRIANIEVRIRSQVNVGTQITLILRCGMIQKETAVNAEQAHISLKGKYILIIDDENHILDGMQYLLSGYGCDVVTAQSLDIAFQELRGRSTVPDLIICDLRLREQLTGADAIEDIREEFNKNIPALLITGDTAPDKINLVKSHEYETLYKPVDPDQLILTINKLLTS